MSLTWRELYKKGTSILAENNIDDAEFDAFQLILFVSGFKKNDYFLNYINIVPPEKERNYFDCISRRVNNEPLQYIIGEWDFYKHRFYVGKGVLIPRPETEELVELCIKIIKQRNYKTILDLCTGSGCIGLSIADACPDTECILVDLYDGALDFTKRNCKRLDLNNVRIVKWDVFDCPDDSFPVFDLIVSNPPYIPEREISSLQKEVLNEPLTALDGGEDGLIFYREIYKKWIGSLSDNGAVAFECGENQTDDIIEIFKEVFECEAFLDSFGKDRFVFCSKSVKGDLC